METVTYIEAGKLLNREHQSIKSAVKVGTLSKYVTRDKRACLIKNQVLLFQGKNRVSLKALTSQEKAEWEKYDEIAKSGIDPDTADTKETINELKTMVDGFKGVMGSLGQMFTDLGSKQYKHASASQEYL